MPSRYSLLSNADIEDIATQYAIPVFRIEAFQGGAVNSSYLITSSNGRYVLTALDDPGELAARRLASLMLYLCDHGIRTGRPVPTREGAYYAIYDGRPVILKSYIPGNCSSQFPDDAVAAAGRLLAKIHRVQAPDWLPSNVRRLPEDIDSRIAEFRDREFARWIRKMLDHVGGLMDRLAGPYGLIHGDFYPDNIVFGSNGELGILDWEAAGKELLVLDVGIAIVGLCQADGVLHPIRTKRLIAGYQEQRPLQQHELSALKDTVIYAAIVIGYYRYFRHNIYRPDESKAHLHQAIPPFVHTVYENWPTVAPIASVERCE